MLEEEKENKNEILKMIKKYVYVCGQEEKKHLAFRDISTKKHKEDFEKIVNFLETK